MYAHGNQLTRTTDDDDDGRHTLNRVIFKFFLRLAGVRQVCAGCAPGLAQIAACASARCLKTGMRRAGEVADFVLQYSSDEKCLR